MAQTKEYPVFSMTDEARKDFQEVFEDTEIRPLRILMTGSV